MRWISAVISEMGASLRHRRRCRTTGAATKEIARNVQEVANAANRISAGIVDVSQAAEQPVRSPATRAPPPTPCPQADALKPTSLASRRDPRRMNCEARFLKWLAHVGEVDPFADKDMRQHKSIALSVIWDHR